MRIVAGTFKGINLYLPKNKKTRPLKDMVKENIFNFLLHSNKINFKLEHSNILDLYSGTGSFALECLSRGANKAIFVEKEKEAIKILKKNIEKMKVKNRTEIFFDDALNFVKKYSKNLFQWSSDLKINLIFCDPPFKVNNINNLIKLIIQKKILDKDGIIILHRHKNAEEKFISNFKIFDERIYGISKIIFGRFF